MRRITISSLWCLFMVGRLFVVGILYVVAHAPSALAEDPQSVIVGMGHSPPISIYNPQGEPSGLAIDVIRDVARLKNWRLTFVNDHWPKLLEMLEAGKIDILTSVAFSQDRERRFDFTSESLLSNWGMLFKKPTASIESVLDLEGLRLAGIPNNIYSDSLHRILTGFGLTYSKVPANSYAEVLRLIEKGDADAGVVSRLFGVIHAHEYAVSTTNLIFEPVEIHYATPKGKGATLRAAIDIYLSTGKINSTSSYKRHLERWLRISVNRQIPPWLIWSSSGALAGLCVALIVIWLLRLRVMAQARALRESEERARIFLNATTDSAILFDTDWMILDVNEAMARRFGKSRDQLIDTYTLDLVPPDLATKRKKRYEEIVCSGQPVETLDERDGLLLENREFPVFDEAGNVSLIVVFSRDVTDQKKAEQEIARARDFHLSLFENAAPLIWRSGLDSKCNYFNQSWLKFTGRTLEQELGDGWLEGVHPEDLDRCFEIYSGAFNRREPFEMEYRLRHNDGSYRWIDDYGMPFDDLDGQFAGMIGHCFDIDKRKQAEEKIEASLAEKEVLLKEIHHRVKNNFQVIASMLMLQANAEKDSKARDALLVGNSRVMAMARVHEKLYGSADLANINAREYLESIVGSVMDGRGENHKNISCDFRIDDVVLSGDQAIPCGLLLNELITNALKHGFPDGRSGTIVVSLHRRDGDRLELAVSNDGESLPDDFDLQTITTLGVKLVSAFAMKLAGEVTVGNQEGTRFSVTFPHERA